MAKKKHKLYTSKLCDLIINNVSLKLSKTKFNLINICKCTFYQVVNNRTEYFICQKVVFSKI